MMYFCVFLVVVIFSRDVVCGIAVVAMISYHTWSEHKSPIVAVLTYPSCVTIRLPRRIVNL